MQERNIPEGGPLVPVFPRPGATAAEAVAWEGLREELERGLSRAGWVLCIACWGNGHICGCRWTGFGESRVQLSCHTRRSVAGRQFCRLMGQGESGTRGSGLLLSDTHRTALGPTFSPYSAGSSFSQGMSKEWVREGAGPRRACWGPGYQKAVSSFLSPASLSALSPLPARETIWFTTPHLPQPRGISRQLLAPHETLLMLDCSQQAERKTTK